MHARPPGHHVLTASVKRLVGGILAVVVFVRLLDLIRGLSAADEEPLLAFPLSVIFPALLVVALMRMPPAASREGILMQLGTMIQCVLIVALPAFALHLALGLPVVFLVVELFETRCPPALRDALARRVVA